MYSLIKMRVVNQIKSFLQFLFYFIFVQNGHLGPSTKTTRKSIGQILLLIPSLVVSLYIGRQLKSTQRNHEEWLMKYLQTYHC